MIALDIDVPDVGDAGSMNGSAVDERRDDTD